MLANGRLDELIYAMGGFRGDGLPFADMRERASIIRQRSRGEDKRRRYDAAVEAGV